MQRNDISLSVENALYPKLGFMNKLTKLNWMSIIGIWPIYLVLNASDIFRFIMADDIYIIYRQVYLDSRFTLMAFLTITIAILPLSISAYWLRPNTRKLLAVCCRFLALSSIYQSFIYNPTMYLSMAFAYISLAVSIEVTKNNF